METGLGRDADVCRGGHRVHNCQRRHQGHDELQPSRPRLKRRGRMRVYEELFIVQPDATDEQIDPLIEQLKGLITQSGGTLDKTEKWGVRRLAYRVLKFSEGQYILLQFTANPEAVKEIERRLRVND